MLDIDYMSANCDFSISQAFAGFNLWSRTETTRKIVTVDPGIGLSCFDDHALSTGISNDVFMKDPTQPHGFFVGNSWSHNVLFVDHTHPNSSEYWGSMLKYLFIKMSYDGVNRETSCLHQNVGDWESRFC